VLTGQFEKWTIWVVRFPGFLLVLLFLSLVYFQKTICVLTRIDFLCVLQKGTTKISCGAVFEVIRRTAVQKRTDSPFLLKSSAYDLFKGAQFLIVFIF
jgi:hypothetical protein